MSFLSSFKIQIKSELPGSTAHEVMSARPVGGLKIKRYSEVEIRESSVLILFYQEAGIWKIPLIQRPTYDGAHGGQVSFPGGRREEADAHGVETALREAEEEIGINRNDVEVIGELTPLVIPVSGHRVQPVVGLHRDIPNFIPEEREVEEVFSIHVNDLLNDEFVKHKQYDIRGVSLHTPFFDIQNKFIWGATAMMLNELKVILKKVYN